MSSLCHPARLIAAATMVLALAACGSQDDEATSPPAPGDEPTSKTTSASHQIPEDLCTAFTAEDFGTVVGATVTMETQPTGSCGFAQEDARAVSGSVSAIPDDPGTGGFEAAQTGASGAMDSADVVQINDIGTKSFLAFGTVFGGESIQVSGGTTDGTVIALITIQQAEGLERSALEDLGRKLLALADNRLH